MLLPRDAFAYYRCFRENVQNYLSKQIEVQLPSQDDIRCWFIELSNGSHLQVYEQLLDPSSSHCDQCRIVGWGHHPTSTKSYHFIIPAEEGPDSLSDPLSLPSIAQARYLGQRGPTSRALAPSKLAEAHTSPYIQPPSIFDSTRHRLHGVVHSNGYGHLLRINGREGGSKSATGLQLVQLWDGICQGLLVKFISTEDVSNKSGMDLRVLHTAATKKTWYGRFGYHFGRGAFNISSVTWRKAAEQVHNALLDGIEHDAQALGDIALLAILQRYRAGVPGKLRLRALGQLLDRMLGLLHNQDEAVLFFQNEALRIAYFGHVKPAAAEAAAAEATAAEVAAGVSSPSKKRKAPPAGEEEEEVEKEQQWPSTSKEGKAGPTKAPPVSPTKKPNTITAAAVKSPSKKKAKTTTATSAPASPTKKPAPPPPPAAITATTTASKKKDKKMVAATATKIKSNPVGSDLIGYKIRYYEKAERTWYVGHISSYNQNTRQHTVAFIKQTLKPKRVKLENERYTLMGLDDNDGDDESGGKEQKGNYKKKNTKEGEGEGNVSKTAGSKSSNKEITKEDKGKQPANKAPAPPAPSKKQQKEASKPSSSNIISFAVSRGRYDPTDKVRRTAKALPLLFPAASTILQPRARTLKKEALDQLFKQVAGEAPEMEWGEEWHVYLGILLDWGQGLVSGGGGGGGGGGSRKGRRRKGKDVYSKF